MKKLNLTTILLAVISILCIVVIIIKIVEGNIKKKINSKKIEKKDSSIIEDLITKETAYIYQLIKFSKNTKSNFTIEVRIAEKQENDELEILADRIKDSLKPKSTVGVIFFYLKDSDVGNIAWAAVDFLPEKSSRIIGLSKNDEKTINKSLDKITDYVGIWKDDGMPGEVLIRIRNDKKIGLVFEFISAENPEPSILPTRIKKTIKKEKTIYIDLDNTEQYFVLEKNGDLSAYDNYGFIVRYRKVK